MSTRQLAGLAIVAALAFAACGDSDSGVATDPSTNGEGTRTTETVTPPRRPGPEQDALDAARAAWQAAAIHDYDYVFTTSCECSVETSGENRVAVRDGRVVRVDYQGMPHDREARTVEEYFDRIQHAIDAGWPNEVTYDQRTGRPMLVLLNTEAIAADGGDGTELVDFTSLAPVRDALDSAEQLWEASRGEAGYTVVHTRSCFCPQDPWTVEVGADGSVEVTTESGVEPHPDDDRPLTVDAMFEEIRAAFDAGVAQVHAEFDPGDGHPTNYFVDVQTIMADEEYGMVVSELTLG